MSKRNIIILGSTGSIGVNTLVAVDHLNKQGSKFNVVGLAAGTSSKKLIEQAKQFNVSNLAIADSTLEDEIRSALPGVTVFSGPDASEKLVENVEATDLAAAMVGFAGLPATLAGLRKGMRISLSNKETLVAAGGLVRPLAQKHGAEIIPVDSEHSAIFQCMAGCPQKQVKKIVLTASGGPFRTASKQEIQNATVEQALKHPTWSMGRKITIDSASMMNKALEIIEAHWLFNLPSEQIDVIIHPQSIAHSFVEFVDHSVLAQLGAPDMRTPIQYALTYPKRLDGCSDSMDWLGLSQLTFESPDTDRFEALKLAYDVIDLGGTAGAIFNGANEAAVAAFLERKVRFGRIVDLVKEALGAVDIKPLDSLETAVEADQLAREYVNKCIAKLEGEPSNVTASAV